MEWDADYTHGLIGGALIGAGSLLAMIATKAIPGVSGVFGRLLRPRQNEVSWRLLFLIGMIAGAGTLFFLSDSAAAYRVPPGRSLPVYALAGLIVGFGTRLGGGCTSGHGVCGNAMGARDSMVATGVFMFAGVMVVWLFGRLAA